MSCDCEENFCEDPSIAYTDENVAWILALQNLTKIILHSKAGEATNFVRRFITRVNVGGLTNFKGVCGNYFDLILDDVLRLGTFSQCRKLTTEQQQTVQEVKLFSTCDCVLHGRFVNIPSALHACGQLDTDSHSAVL
jgi:hypothetical protein